MHQLWVEKYRPNVINDYVFKDQKQKNQIENWIKSGALPHLLLSGVQGTGKCLGPNEKIKVRINVELLSHAQVEKIKHLL